ncbi:MAG: GNAT family N-acetyltransferase [Pseudonocardiaceae bacterium]
MTVSNIESTGGADVTFRRYDAASARQIRAVVEAVYVGSYVDAIASGDPFDSVETFMHRFDAYTSGSSFDLVVAFQGDDAVGQTWGWPLNERATTTGWWAGLLEEPEPGFTWEDGHRTFGLSEIMVLQDWTGKGIAHALHNQLLLGREEQRATLLVEPDNVAARRAYLHWGWRKVAQLRPGWEHAPLFDVLILPLPLHPLSR